MKIGQKVKVEFNHPSLQSDAVGIVNSIFDTFVVVEFPQNFVFEGEYPKFKEKKDYPKWLSNPEADKKSHKYLPYVSFLSIAKNKIICQ